MSELPEDTDRALLSCSLWLHTGYVGAVGVAAGLIQLFVDGTDWLSTLSLAGCGGILAAVSWRRAQAVLERADRATTRTPGTRSAADTVAGFHRHRTEARR